MRERKNISARMIRDGESILKPNQIQQRVLNVTEMLEQLGLTMEKDPSTVHRIALEFQCAIMERRLTEFTEKIFQTIIRAASTGTLQGKGTA